MKSLLDVLREAREELRTLPPQVQRQMEINRALRIWADAQDMPNTCSHCGARIGKTDCLSCYP